MPKAHSFQLHIGDIIKDTYHLPPEVFGAYMRLLMAHYSMGEDGIPADPKTLARIAGVSPHLWGRLEKVLKPFFKEFESKVGVTSSKFWRHSRVIRELQKQGEFSAKQSANARARWETENANASAKQDAKQMPTDMPNACFPVSSLLTPEDSKEITSPHAHIREGGNSVKHLEDDGLGTGSSPPASVITQGLGASMRVERGGATNEGNTLSEYLKAADIAKIPDAWLMVGRAELKRILGVDPNGIGQQAERFQAYFSAGGKGEGHRSRDWASQFLGFVRKTRPPLPPR